MKRVWAGGCRITRILGVCLAAILPALAATPHLIPAGVARLDITPTNAVPLMGYAARAQLAAPTNVAQRIHVRALALGADPAPAVLVTLDNCILPGAITVEIRTRLSRQLKLAPEQIALTVTHTHSAPCLTGAAPNIFGREITPTEQAEIDSYTRYFTDRVEEAVLAALKDRQPAQIAWGRGAVGFAKNRRTVGGPVDHDLPLLRITRPDGSLRAVFVSYACHCTTLSGELNAVHGDWAGVAAQTFEQEHPNTVALVAIGAGADANPDPRGTLELVNRHGESLAAEAARLVTLPLTELTNAPTGRLRTLQLRFQPLFTRSDWERRATNSGIVGYHARRWLDRLDRGETVLPTLPYPVQTWTFGRQLAMVFLGGEVVVDYSLRLKRELNPNRIWVNAYANDVPCYIPSRRILQEGGYEAETSLWYYDRPQQLSPAIEDQIINAVRELLPKSFEFDPSQAEMPPAKSPEEALLALRPAPGFQVELVAHEPLIESPVAIDFGADGRLWVAEMRDYPSGLDGEGKPGGRVKVLTDVDGDGRFDQAMIVADDLPFPTGLMTWRDGALVCAAPDVWWFRPGKTAGAKWTGNRLLTGFATHNFQARVNGLRWGLDGWVYGSGGLFGGAISVAKTGQTYDCQNRDFRFHPDTGEFEPLAGVSQQGRVRDDFGNWFGNDNSTLAWHFPLPDHYTRGNPYVIPPAARVVLPGEGDVGRVYPASRTLVRFNDPEMANRLTSACGLEIYRDELLGPDVDGDLLVCEPVHNLVRRAKLDRDGIHFRSRRAPGEMQSEFLASTDNWFRPVEVRTGPDGALWVVDLNRFVIEHPRWIPPERLRELDVRAGSDSGRIWRISRTGKSSRPIRDLARFIPVQLAQVLESPNGVERDLAHRGLLYLPSDDAAVRAELERIATQSSRPASRAQALSVLSQRDGLNPTCLAAGLKDPDPRVQRVALTLAEGCTNAVSLLASMPLDEIATTFQFLLTLSTFKDSEAAERWGGRSSRVSDPWLRTAWLLAARPVPLIAFHFLDTGENKGIQVPLGYTGGGAEAFAGLLAMTAGDQRTPEFGTILTRLVPPNSETINAQELWAMLGLQAELLRHPDLRTTLQREGSDEVKRSLERLQNQVTPWAMDRLARGELSTFPEVTSPAAVAVLGLQAQTIVAAGTQLLGLLDANWDSSEKRSVLAALRGVSRPNLANEIVTNWGVRPPRQRSELVSLLLGREEWTETLLRAVQENAVGVAEFSPAQRQQLRQHPKSEIRESAEALFPVATSDRSGVVARFASVTNLSGNPHQGGESFDRLCSSCHRLRGRGYSVGPDLAPFRSKPAGDFLTAILDPNAAVEPRFVAWTVGLRDGRSLTGVVRDESSASLSLVEPGGASTDLKRSEIEHLSPSPLSLMPEGLESGISAEQLADLIAWMKAGPASFGQADADQTASARRRFLACQPARVEGLAESGEVLPYPSWMGTLPLHLCRMNDGTSRVTWKAQSESSRFRIPVAMGFWSQPAGPFSFWVNGREALNFEVTLEDAVWTRPDGAVELRYQVEENNSEDSNGMLEVTIASSWAPVGEPVRFEVRGPARASQRWFGLYELPDSASQ